MDFDLFQCFKDNDTAYTSIIYKYYKTPTIYISYYMMIIFQLYFEEEICLYGFGI